MDIIKSYKELCGEIEMWKWRIEAYKAEIKALKKMAKIYGPGEVRGVDYSQPNVQSSGHVAFEEYLIRLQQLENHIYLHEEAIASMIKSKEKIEENLEDLKGLDMKVVYMRDIENMTLGDIADKLGYSEIYIKKISARNKRVY